MTEFDWWTRVALVVILACMVAITAKMVCCI